MSTKTTPAPKFVSLTNDQTAPGSDFTSGQFAYDAHERVAAGDQTPGGHDRSDTHIATAAGSQAAQSHRTGDDQDTTALGPILADPVLGMLADVVDDIEKARCASENRLRILITPADELCADGKARGHGLTLEHPDVANLAGTVALMKCDSDVLKERGWPPRPKKVRGVACCLEHGAIANLRKVMRQHPLWAWAKPVRGLGEKQFARLLAAIDDPYWNELDDRPRTVSDLRSYCGYGDADKQVRRRGQKSNWNEDARKRCHLIAASCIKQARSPYRKVYDDTRLKYADAVHTAPCVRCGPKGKPAPAGSPLSLGHQHKRGLRAVSKEFLKDLWREAKCIHEAQSQEVAS